MMKRRDRWMISYLDVLTILLILFIAAAARTVPLRKWRLRPRPCVVDAR